VWEAFGLSDEHKMMVAIAIGYEEEVSTLDEKKWQTSRAPRVRKPLGERVSFNRVIIEE
jgi:hypothetical protein